MPQRLKPCAVLLLALLPAAAQAAGGVFRWVDRGGVVHYDDQSLLQERMTRATIARGSVPADAKATVPVEFVVAVARQCQDLRERSNSYAEAAEIFARDPAGNQYRLSETQAALERARLAQDTRAFCGPLASEKLLAKAMAALAEAEARNAPKNAAAAR